MFILALVMFISLVGLYLALSAALLYHLWRFDIDERVRKRAVLIFSSVSLVLLIFATIVFLRMPWQELL